VEAQLREDKSPEQISGILHKDGHAVTLSPEAIYQYVWEDKRKGGTWCLHLRNQGRKYARTVNLRLLNRKR